MYQKYIRLGIKLPFDPKHIVYVWIDALSNYITFLGYDVNGNHSEGLKILASNYHIIGKDIVRFHTIYWPILLMALDLPLPKTIYGHPWLTIEVVRLVNHLAMLFMQKSF